MTAVLCVCLLFPLISSSHYCSDGYLWVCFYLKLLTPMTSVTVVHESVVPFCPPPPPPHTHTPAPSLLQDTVRGCCLWMFSLVPSLAMPSRVSTVARVSLKCTKHHTYVHKYYTPSLPANSWNEPVSGFPCHILQVARSRSNLASSTVAAASSVLSVAIISLYQKVTLSFCGRIL